VVGSERDPGRVGVKGEVEGLLKPEASVSASTFLVSAFEIGFDRFRNSVSASDPESESLKTTGLRFGLRHGAVSTGPI